MCLEIKLTFNSIKVKTIIGLYIHIFLVIYVKKKKEIIKWKIFKVILKRKIRFLVFILVKQEVLYFFFYNMNINASYRLVSDFNFAYRAFLFCFCRVLMLSWHNI